VVSLPSDFGTHAHRIGCNSGGELRAIVRNLGAGVKRRYMPLVINFDRTERGER
jgi:hypothetical protein